MQSEPKTEPELQPDSKIERRLGKADTHIHSSTGDALPAVTQILEYVETQTELDVIAITDHDELRGSFEAREISAQRGYRAEVMVGCEITTLDGHLVALDIESPIRMLQSMEKTIEAVHRQGGICIIAHPMSWLTLSAGQRVLKRVKNSELPYIYFDGLEAFNPSIAGRVAHDRVKQFNREFLKLPEVGGSDAHHLHLVGSAITVFEGQTAQDFRDSLKQGTTCAVGEFWTANEQIEGLAALQFKSLVVHPSQKVRRALSGVFGGSK
jgi:predicted metal-dependent phosphoesterase TrpH